MQIADFAGLFGLEMKHEVVYSLRMVKFNVLFLFRFQELSFAECRSKKANSHSVKVEFFIYGPLYPPYRKDKML